MLFLYFQNFNFWGFMGGLGWGARGGRVEGQKVDQNDKNICLTPYLRNRTSHDCGFWYTYVK